jgi:hypothetical protein
VKIEVTAYDIQRGGKEKGARAITHCAVARAIRRHFPKNHVEVGFTSVSIGEKRGWLSWTVGKKIDAIMHHEQVKPFTFNLPKLTVLLLSLMLLATTSFAQHREFPGEHIDNLAKTAAHSGSDTDLKTFVDAAVRPAGVPPVIAYEFRRSIVRAELEFRAGKHPGITEKELLEFHNRLAAKLNLPTYAMVDQKQLRFMRMGISQLEPIAMSPVKQNPQDKEISPVLSPAQAAHLESMLIMQKIANPVFQVEPKTWTPELAKKIQAKESEKRFDKPSAKSTDTITTSLPNSIQKGISDLSISQSMDILRDVNRTFKFHEGK